MIRSVPLLAVAFFVTSTSIVGGYQAKVNEKIVAAQLAHQKETEKLRETLLTALKKAEETARKAGNKAQLDKIKEETQAFESRKIVPAAVPTKDYYKKLHKANKSFEDAYVTAIKTTTKAGNDTEAESLEKELNEFRNSAKFLNGKQYLVVKSEISWNDARLACEKQGGHLAIILSEDENAFITKLQQAENLKFAFIGATDNRKEGQWYWIDGSKWNYANWDQDHRQPNNRSAEGKPEHVAGISTENNGKWWDLPMQDKIVEGFICQWD